MDSAVKQSITLPQSSQGLIRDQSVIDVVLVS